MHLFRGLKVPPARSHDAVRVSRSNGGVAIQATDGLHRASTAAFVSPATARKIASALVRLADETEH